MGNTVKIHGYENITLCKPYFYQECRTEKKIIVTIKTPWSLLSEIRVENIPENVIAHTRGKGYVEDKF